MTLLASQTFEETLLAKPACTRHIFEELCNVRSKWHWDSLRIDVAATQGVRYGWQGVRQLRVPVHSWLHDRRARAQHGRQRSTQKTQVASWGEHVQVSSSAPDVCDPKCLVRAWKTSTWHAHIYSSIGHRRSWQERVLLTGSFYVRPSRFKCDRLPIWVTCKVECKCWASIDSTTLAFRRQVGTQCAVWRPQPLNSFAQFAKLQPAKKPISVSASKLPSTVNLDKSSLTASLRKILRVLPPYVVYPLYVSSTLVLFLVPCPSCPAVFVV